MTKIVISVLDTKLLDGSLRPDSPQLKEAKNRFRQTTSTKIVNTASIQYLWPSVWTDESVVEVEDAQWSHQQCDLEQGFQVQRLYTRGNINKISINTPQSFSMQPSTC